MDSILEKDILLTTLNARYIHAAFGLRYLLANLAELESRAEILEFTISQATETIADALLSRNPRIIGVGVYIWNAEESLALVRVLKARRPEIQLVLGGPEVSHESEVQEIVQLADHTIRGEGDVAFADLCRRLITKALLPPKVITPPLPSLPDLVPPYALYNDEDLAHRVLYVEASRGCAFSCEFCLSSMDKAVRAFPLEGFLDQIDQLWKRGARRLKFVDRTFNLNPRASAAILEFFLQRLTADTFLHFEMVPDRLPESLRTLIAQFPPAALQFEVGIQTFNEEVAARISRRQDYPQLEENLCFLREQTGVYIHADLIAGLPGEDLTSFAEGFDRLLALRPHEIQVGILKRLRGTPITRHDEPFGMRYAATPPYQILETSALPGTDIERVQRFARQWDLYGNSGHFRETLPLLISGGSAFWSMMAFCEWVYETYSDPGSAELLKLLRRLFDYLTQVRRLEPAQVAGCLVNDFLRGRPEQRAPKYLTRHLVHDPHARRSKALPDARALPKRQARSLEA